MKKILLNSYIEGNMDCLYRYYKENLEEKYSKEYKVILKSHYQYKNNKLLNYYHRILEYLGKYHIVVSDYPTRLYIRSKYGIYISHGYGTKNTPGLEELNNKKVMNMYKSMRNNLDYIITLSKRDENYFLKSDWLDQFKKPKYIPLGLPRNDELFNETINMKKKNEFDRKYGSIGRKKILYCPTWRNYKIDNDIFNESNIKLLNRYLQDNNCILFYRGHYLNSIIDLELIKNMSNIKDLGFEQEEYTQNILPAIDILITDYSSIYVDYLALDRPIIFFNFDSEKYISERGLAIDLNDIKDTPGIQVKNINELIEAINSEVNYENNSLMRKDAIENFYTYKDGDSSKRIWKLMLGLK